jgi:cytoskeletal protein CcmA (bactofilin family)
MADLRLRSIDESEIDTILAEDIDFDGNMNFHKPVLIKGKFSGSIHASGDLFVNSDAVVEATIEAQTVSLKGTIKGDIYAAKRLELFSASRLEGNIRTPDMIMQSGCIFNGTCTMERAAQQKGADAGNEKK